jgi:hypothetical protein
MASRTLIHKTHHTPQVTEAWIRRTAKDMKGIDHVRFVIDQCASQKGRNACQAAYDKLQQIENAYFANT